MTIDDILYSPISPTAEDFATESISDLPIAVQNADGTWDAVHTASEGSAAQNHALDHYWQNIADHHARICSPHYAYFQRIADDARRHKAELERQSYMAQQFYGTTLQQASQSQMIQGSASAPNGAEGAVSALNNMTSLQQAVGLNAQSSLNSLNFQNALAQQFSPAMGSLQGSANLCSQIQTAGLCTSSSG